MILIQSHGLERNEKKRKKYAAKGKGTAASRPTDPGRRTLRFKAEEKDGGHGEDDDNQELGDLGRCLLVQRRG